MADSVGRPLAYKTSLELQKAVDAYFESCFRQKEVGKEKGDVVMQRVQFKPFTVTGLCAFLKVDRATLCRYENKDIEGVDDEYCNIIKDAKLKIEAEYEEKALSGDNNAIFTIFAMKNHFKWKDRTETDVTSGDKPIALLNLAQTNVRNNHSNAEDPSNDGKNPGSAGGNVSVEDDIDSALPDSPGAER